MKTTNQNMTTFLPFVQENVDIMKELAGWLSDEQGDLDMDKAAQLAQLLHPEDGGEAEAFRRRLTDAWTKQGAAIRHAAAVSLGI